MNISKPFIQRPVMTTLVMAGILFFGIIAYTQLPVSDLPSFAFPSIMVTASNPGADAATMASTIATPLEKQIMTIDGLRAIVSSSSQNQTSMALSFDLDKSIDSASTDTAAALNRAAGELPTEMPDPPQYKKYNPSATPVLWIAVSSDTMTLPDLYDYANTAIAQRISMIEGVSQVLIYGSKRALRIKLDPDRLASMGLGLNEIADSIEQANQQLPAGTVYDSHTQYTLNPKGQLFTGEAYDPIILANRNMGPVRVEDLGRGVDSTQDENFYNGFWNEKIGKKPTIVLGIDKREGHNTVKLCNSVIAMIPQFKQEVPPSISIDVIYNTALGIESSVREVEQTLLIAFALVVLVILLFLGSIRSTIIPSIVLPMAIIGTFMFMYVNGYSLDILSLLGLTLVIGFLVDDAIVVLENVVRHMEMGKSAMEATLDGSRQISTTIVSMTLSLTAVFIPIIFMPGVIGRMFHEFAMVVVIAVLFSGFLSLTLTPMLCSRFLKQHPKKRRLSDRLIQLYLPALHWVLRHRWVPIGSATAALAIALWLFVVIPEDFLPQGDTGAIQGVTVAADSASPVGLTNDMRQLSAIAEQSPYVESVVTGANIPNLLLPNQGAFFIMLKSRKHRPPIDEVVQDMYTRMEGLTDLDIFMRPFPQINLDVGTTLARADYTYFLSSLGHREELYSAATKLTEEMKKIPELTQVSSDVQNENPMLTIDIDRDRARQLGISTQIIENTFSLAYAGAQLAQYSTDIDTYRIIVEMEDDFRRDPTSLDKIFLRPSNLPASPLIINPNTSNDSNTWTTNRALAMNDLVPLSEVAKWQVTTGPVTVTHLDQLTAATLFFNLAPGAALGTATKKVEELADEILPEGVLRQFQGTAQVFRKTIPAIIALMILGIVAIYLLLGVLYESFVHPLTILSALPGALFGGLLTLAIAGASLSLYVYVGMIVLIGIVMKNGIMLVEFAQQNRAEGKSAYDAIILACEQRFRPILMTTVAAAMGAIPIALGLGGDAATRRPMGLIVLGGLLVAQFITYFFTPTVYLLLSRGEKRSSA